MTRQPQKLMKVLCTLFLQHGGAQGSASPSTPQPQQVPLRRRRQPPSTTQRLLSSQKVSTQAIEDVIPDNIKEIRNAPFEEVYENYLTEDQQDTFDDLLALPNRIIKDDEGNFEYDMANFTPYTELSPMRESSKKKKERLQRHFRRRAEIRQIHDDAVDTSYGLGPERAGGMEDKSLIPRPRTEEEQARFDAEKKQDAEEGAPTDKEKEYAFMLSKDWSNKFSAPMYETLQDFRDPASNLRTNADGSQRSLDDTYAVLYRTQQL